MAKVKSTLFMVSIDSFDFLAVMATESLQQEVGLFSGHDSMADGEDDVVKQMDNR